MGQGRAHRYLDQIRGELHRSFVEPHTPRETAGSFALWTFITMLPTLDIGLILFVIIGYAFEWVSKLALFASVILFNPVVKWGCLPGEFHAWRGLTGAHRGVSMTDVSINATPDIVIRLLVGNLILAVIAAVSSYFVVHRLSARYASDDVAKAMEEVLEEVAEIVLEQ